ncbi:MAG: hypothetical protein WC544_05040 [Patescibacteria group bacterium]
MYDFIYATIGQIIGGVVLFLGALSLYVNLYSKGNKVDKVVDSVLIICGIAIIILCSLMK